MSPDQVDIIVRAAQKLLEQGRDLLYYLTLLMPIAAAVIGWLAASSQFRASFKKNLEKEHYYASKEHVMEIVKRHTSFLSYLYEFYKKVKGTFNVKQQLPVDTLTDFITEYNFKLAEILQLSRIEFPGQPIDIMPTIDLLKKLEVNIAEMDQTIAELRQQASTWVPGMPPLSSPDSQINLLNHTSTILINGIIDELTKHENMIVQALVDESVRLGLSPKPKIILKAKSKV